MEDKILMSKQELDRVKYIEMAIEKQITQEDAAKFIGLGYRQTKRIIKKVKANGIESIVHGNRGKQSPKQISDEIKNKITKIYQLKYPDFGPTFACEKLSEIDSINLSKETLRKILIDKGIWTVRKRKTEQLHIWRERKARAGELVQLDGSHHRWLENRLDQEFCLMAYIDDATGNICAKFYDYEGIMPAFDSLIQYATKYGFPHSLYLDRHSTYKTTRDASVDEQLKKEQSATQFEKVMKRINVKVIHAYSPQAKGRVERLFETLQDRLVKEMRLANICTIKAANKFLMTYLQVHNKKFSKSPKSSVSMHHKVPDDFDYKWTFAIQDSRSISKDYTIWWMNRLFLVKNPTLSLKGAKILIKQALNGDLRFETKTKILTVKEITEKDITLIKNERKRIKKVLATPTYKKSKKSWMDNFYIGNPKAAFSRQNELTKHA